MGTDLTLREKGQALYTVATFRPLLTVAIVACSGIVAVLEGIGVSFILPIVEVVQGQDSADADGMVAYFITAFEVFNIPFTLGYIVLVIGAVMTVRFGTSILLGWLRIMLQTWYVRELQQRAFRGALDAHTAYYDQEGSDDILNAIVTQAEYAGKVIRDGVRLFSSLLMITVYLSIAFVISPWLTILAGVAIGGLTVAVRSITEAGYTVGDRVADANEAIQSSAQAGTQGIREVKMVGLGDELYENFREHLEQFTDATITLGRNEEIINNVYNLAIALLVFGLIYISLTIANLSLAAMSVFLYAMFQVGPRVSQANKYFYKMEGRLPHLVRTQQFIGDLEANRDLEGGDRSVPVPVTPIEFEDVSFSYDDETPVLEGISFEVGTDEFVAFVGQSGAGKSTIAALFARLYAPDSGTITAAGTPIEEYDIDAWRARIAYVRQDPFIFNDTLRRNVAVANPSATQAEIERACAIAQVTEFVDELPKGYDTTLGDNGVRLSGGQRQRVALARGLLEDADILVLDEATSDLDTSIEQEVQTALQRAGEDRTIVAIAHRLSTVRDADRIYALEGGQIRERGTHDQLLEREGTYAELYASH